MNHITTTNFYNRIKYVNNQYHRRPFAQIKQKIPQNYATLSQQRSFKSVHYFNQEISVSKRCHHQGEINSLA